MAKEKTIENTTQNDFGPETLLIFVGHSDDAREEAKIIKHLQGDLQEELNAFLKAAPNSHSYKVIKVWEWNYDADRTKGGQAKVISPYLHSASIALFVFKERIGKVTWDELTESRNRENPIPILALFPAQPLDLTKLASQKGADDWAELVRKKSELTKDWTAAGSKSLTPVEDYADREQLKKITFAEIRKALPRILNRTQMSQQPAAYTETSQRFLDEPAEFGYDRTLVLGCTWDQLDQKQLEGFLSKELSLDAAAKAGNTSPTTTEHLKILGLLRDKHPVLGAFFCFAPTVLIEGKFDACSLQLVRYDGTSKADSSHDTTPVCANLLQLFEEGLAWLKTRSGLKRVGTVGSSRRDDLEIPEIALREALANALVHRNYEDPVCRDQPTRIEVFEDRVVITSYGNLPTGISLEDLNEDPESVSPIRRNPAIAKIFNFMTHVELNASGVSRMLRETKRAALPAPKIIAENNTVRVEFIRRSPEGVETLKQQSQPGGGGRSFRPSKSTRSAFISSAALDMPEHRENVKEACLRQGLFPVMMEHLPALDSEAISISLEMIDQSDIYIGVFGYRYGYIPKENNPRQVSIAELEFNRAIELGIPVFIFVMGGEHPVRASEFEQGPGAEKLDILKKQLSAERVVNYFNSPGELRAEVINTLSRYLKEVSDNDEGALERESGAVFHYVSDIPPPPEPYIAHPYTLLQTHNLVGRQHELNLLTDWAAKSDSEVYRAHVLSVVAIGGIGKSALTWKWFNDIAPHEMRPLAGRIWWSFYESDATFENFVIRTLAYIAKISIEEVRQIPAPERETQLLSILDKESHLLVLDGLERILVAYARMDAAYLADDDYDRKTANYVANAYGLPPEAAQSFAGEHRLRKTADPRAGAFLRKLSKVRSARILISTRLYPFDLQRIDALPLPGCYAVFLPGLSNDDALNLWRSLGVSGAQDQLIPVFNSFGNHALLVQALASEVANFRAAPGDFEKWREANPHFDPAKYPHLQDAMGHALEYAMHGLGEKEKKVLQTIAGFRMSTGYNTLSAVLTGEGKPCADARELDAALVELEDRGLVGWDKRANRYDLHPIVRGVVWSGLGNSAKQGVYTRLHAHFEALPSAEDYVKIKNLEDLTPAIELYHALIGMERYDNAFEVFRDRLNKATLYRLSANRQRVEMLEMLFPSTAAELPRLTRQGDQAFTLVSLALAYKLSGQPGKAVSLYRQAKSIFPKTGDNKELDNTLENLSNTLRATGGLRESEGVALITLGNAREKNRRFDEGTSLQWLGLAFSARGEIKKATVALKRSTQIFVSEDQKQSEGVANSYLAQSYIWSQEYNAAAAYAIRAGELAKIKGYESDLIEAARLWGQAFLGLGDLEKAEERLNHALARARAVNLVEEELPALTALAEMRLRQNDEKAARELLDDIWEYAERGPYPLLHADALNVLAQIERDAGNGDKAIEAATKAYQLAWCDGPPYAYHWGLIKAQKHLEELGASLPEMPPFDESKYEPMPEVEIDPDDEFRLGENAETV